MIGMAIAMPIKIMEIHNSAFGEYSIEALGKLERRTAKPPGVAADGFALATTVHGLAPSRDARQQPQ